LSSFLAQIYPTKFNQSERIVRFIYTTQNFNPKTNELRPNFVKFDFNQVSGKNEMSTVRFELDSLENCRRIGKGYERPENKATYHGLGCISVREIKSIQKYSLKFTPKRKQTPKIIFHTDIYDNESPPIQKGVASSALVTLERDRFAKMWTPIVEPIERKDVVVYR
jgi:hypothetical protein